MKLQRHHSEQDCQRLGQTCVGAPESLEIVEEPVEEPLKCVWSGYPDYNRDCRSRIPASVVVKAWHREIQLKGTVEGFFYFSWRSGVWLAYGLQEGGVRGVYCPTHCFERDARDAQSEDSPASLSEGQPPPRGVESSSASEPAQSPARDAPVAWPAYAVGRSSL